MTKIERRNINEGDVKAAISEVILKTSSIRQAADKYNVKAATLQHRNEKFLKSDHAPSSPSKEYHSKYIVTQVFSTQKVKMLTEY